MCLFCLWLGNRRCRSFKLAPGKFLIEITIQKQIWVGSRLLSESLALTRLFYSLMRARTREGGGKTARERQPGRERMCERGHGLEILHEMR